MEAEKHLTSHDRNSDKNRSVLAVGHNATRESTQLNGAIISTCLSRGANRGTRFTFTLTTSAPDSLNNYPGSICGRAQNVTYHR